jgi:hypothetical protein
MDKRTIIEKLQKGETVTYKEGGNSMTPTLRGKDEITVAPVKIENLKKRDIVFCKVKGNYYTHKVYAIDNSNQRVLIGNNHGHINGWTKQVYGVVIAINGASFKHKNRTIHYKVIPNA